uniref:Reverse transcriptase domain-containing protein n=1 Tax=Cacopsylla melanoneura TaxID=428564 RepID=A0A8D8SBU3_9HEMI
MADDHIILSEVRRLYGSPSVQQISRIIKLNQKLATHEEDLVFLQACKENDVFPNFIKNCCKFIVPKDVSLQHKKNFENIQSRTHRQLLNAHIKEQNSTIRNLKNKINTANSDFEIKFNPSVECLLKIREFVSSAKNKSKLKKIDTLDKKFNNIIGNKLINKKNIMENVTKKWFKNLTKEIVPLNIQYVLSLGPKYNLPMIKLPVYDCLKEIEYILDDIAIDDSAKNKIRGNVTNLLTEKHKDIKSNHNTKDPLVDKRTLKQTKQYLIDHPDLIITRSDKGQVTVLMYKSDYEEKMLEILQDNSYKLSKTDPTSKFMKKNNYLIKKMHDLNHITDHKKRELMKYNSVVPKIYGLPKIHKPELKLRPIVSCINSPTYNLSKLLVPILQPLKNPEYNVKNSYQFRDFIKSKTINNGYKLISLDVVSLFTKIPTSLAVNLVLEKWDIIKNHTDIDLDLFKEIIEFCLSTAYFTYNGSIYTQSSLAMGCSLSPIIADIVLDDLFDKILPQLNDSVQFCVKYVDDTFLSVDENKIDFVLNTFNSYHPEIQFTLEVENNCCLPFLDVSVIKNTNGSVDICHYKKPTCSGRLLNYNSNQPYSYKINCAKNLINRTLNLSDSKFHDNLIPEIYSTLIDNNYPKNLIKKLIQNRNSNSTHQNISNNLPPIYYSFPYLGETSYKVEKTMKTLVPSIKFGHGSCNPLKSRGRGFDTL